MGHGWLVIIVEVGLLAVFLFHIVAGVVVSLTDKAAARRIGYRYAKNAGGKSRKGLSSSTMIYSGIVLALFVIVHIRLFKYGHHELDVHGVKNLYKTVVFDLKGPVFAAFTAVSMVLLGFHLRHGFWSAFQSMGWTNDRVLPCLTKAAVVVAVVLSAGFLVITVWAFVAGDPNALGGGH